ncbi:hypothetical protein ACFL0U_00555 [Pseudomonadota bacterium]
MLNPKEKTLNLVKILSLHLIVLFFVTLNVIPIVISDTPNISPMFSVIVVFYFTVYKTEIFSNFFIFLIGIWVDSLRALPLGTTSLALLLSVKIIHEINSRLLTKDTFLQLVNLFVIFCAIFSFIKWSILSLFYTTPYPVIPVFLNIGVTILLYILLHNLFDFLNAKLTVHGD